MNDDKMEPTKKKRFPFFKVNPWKWAFLALVVLILGSGLFVTTRIFSIREPHYTQKTTAVRAGDPVLTISSNKTQVNQLISFFLEEYLKDSEVKYDFVLENEAMLTGEFKVLGFSVTIYLYFDPYVMEDGNVQLRVKSLSVGTLDLPLKEVLKLVKRSFKFPEWIEMDTEAETMLLRLDQFQLENGMFIKANRINLLDDEIQFSLYLPKEDKKSQSTTTSSTD